MALIEPLQQSMPAAPLGPTLNKYDGLFVQQTPRGWLQEMFGCEAVSEYKISQLDEDFGAVISGGRWEEKVQKYPAEMYAIEKGSCLMRQCLKEGRPMTMHVSMGADAGGNRLVEYHKEMSLSARSCCCLPALTTKKPDGTELNKSTNVFMCCSPIPQFSFQEPPGTELYRIHPPLCCGGFCIKCEFGKGRCGTLPFYFYDTEGNQVMNTANEDFPPQIRLVRSGLLKAMCTSANNYAIKFPARMSAEQKSGILGMAFLIDFSFFEKQNEKN